MLHLLVKEVVGKSTDKGVKEVPGSLGKEASQLGNVTFPFVFPWVPAPCWSLLPLPLPPCCFFAPLKKSSWIFFETQHLLSVPALQLIISMNISHWRPDMLQFKDYIPSVYELFPKKQEMAYFLWTVALESLSLPKITGCVVVMWFNG